MHPRHLARALLVVVLSPASVVAAQSPGGASPSPRWELRAAAPLSPDAGLLAGVGGEIRAGWYTRVGVGVLAGAIRHDGAWQARQHVGVTARFLFDPFFERRRGLYGGAGLGLSLGEGRSSRGELLLIGGIEFSGRGRVLPALEIVLGGGVRAQAVIRARRDVGR